VSDDPPPEQTPGRSDAEERAPLLGSWWRWYGLIAVELVALIALFWWFTVSFR
jgi:hypothetical protein